jgi:acetyl-CoA carboxylase biotin carboxyl carrier protein
MPEPQRPNERTVAQRQADHAGLAHLSETLVPALVAKLNGSGLGELEVREGDWRVRLRRPPTTGTGHRRSERARPGPAGQERRDLPRVGMAGVPAVPEHDPAAARSIATSPAVGVFRSVAGLGGTVRQGDRIGVVDLLGVPQDVVAPVDGVLAEFLVETGDAVEYGEEVAAIDPPPAAPALAGPGEEG